MYKSDAGYVSCRTGIYYYTRRVPFDVRQHYTSNRLSFNLRTKSNAGALEAAQLVTQHLEDRNNLQTAQIKWCISQTNSRRLPNSKTAYRFWEEKSIKCEQLNCRQALRAPQTQRLCLEDRPAYPTHATARARRALHLGRLSARQKRASEVFVG